MALWDWLGRSDADTADSEAVRRIAAELEGLAPNDARFLAAFAFLLARVASVDHEITTGEAQAMQRIVAETAALTADRAALVTKLAVAEQRVVGGTDGFLVSRELTRISTYDQRLAIVRCLFAVATADHRVHHQEGEEIGRIARELRIEPPDLAHLRLEFRQFL